ncbi:PIG-L family deacetylase, partial [bacterium]|nr:PIG-L family deacetylase [bacterium]
MRGCMQWIYLSPHLDDAVLSCGGMIAEQASGGDSIQIWTICAGAPPAGRLSPFARKLHQRWGTGRDAIKVRRLEDRAACQRLGAVSRHFPIPDCIYRQDPITGRPLIV